MTTLDLDGLFWTRVDCNDAQNILLNAESIWHFAASSARTTAELNRATFALMCRHQGRFRTITADNGTELPNHRSLEAATGVPFFATRHQRKYERTFTPVSAGGRSSVWTGGCVVNTKPLGLELGSITRVERGSRIDHLEERRGNQQGKPVSEEMKMLVHPM